MYLSAASAAERRPPAAKTSVWWTVAFTLAALFVAARSARAQHGGFHTHMTQQGGRVPLRPAPPPPAANSNGAGGGNSMFPTTPSSAGAMRNHLQAGPTGRWWDDRHVAETVGLRQDQKARMDAIFNANKASIVSAYQTYLKEKERFEKLSKQAQPDKAQMFASIDAVNGARTALEKATDKMLLEIRAELDPGQLAQLQSLQ